MLLPPSVPLGPPHQGRGHGCHDHQDDRQEAVVSAGALASQRVRGRLGREPAGRTDDARERPALAHRRRARRSGSSRTMPHPARSCGPPGARWPPRARWRAATVSCRSSRHARTGRTGAGETTILRWPRSRRSRSRWAAWLCRLRATCSRWLPSWPSPAPHRLARNHHRLDPELAGHAEVLAARRGRPTRRRRGRASAHPRPPPRRRVRIPPASASAAGPRSSACRCPCPAGAGGPPSRRRARP
jgi:hypothetical protein